MSTELASWNAAPTNSNDDVGEAPPPPPPQEQENQERHFLVELFQFNERRPLSKKLMAFFIMASSVYVLYDLFFLGNVRAFINMALQWMTDHPFGALYSFLIFFVVSTLLFVPPAILMFGAGYVFARIAGFGYGVLVATAVSFFGSCLGAILAFLRARYMMRDLIQLFAKRYPIVKAADHAFEKNGFRVMLLLRLCPIIPFNGLNYIGGVTAISLEDFTKALIGVLPTIVLWSFCGAAADSLSNSTTTTVEGDGAQVYMFVLLSTGIVFFIVAFILIWKYSMQKLKAEIDMETAETWWKYKKMPSAQSPTSSTSIIAETNLEEGQEVIVQEQHGKLYGVLPLLGIQANGLEGHYSGPEDASDEEWFWFWV